MLTTFFRRGAALDGEIELVWPSQEISNVYLSGQVRWEFTIRYPDYYNNILYHWLVFEWYNCLSLTIEWCSFFYQASEMSDNSSLERFEENLCPVAQ